MRRAASNAGAAGSAPTQSGTTSGAESEPGTTSGTSSVSSAPPGVKKKLGASTGDEADVDDDDDDDGGEGWNSVSGDADSWFDVIKRQEEARKAEELRCVAAETLCLSSGAHLL